MPEFDTDASIDEAGPPNYMEGMCHVFALAIHRQLGLPFLLLLNKANGYPDEESPGVHHVYVLDGQGSAYDFQGRHDADEVTTQWLHAEDPACRPGVLRLDDEECLRDYVETGRDRWDRSLAFYTEDDITRATKVAQERLGRELPGLLGQVTPVAGR